MSCRWHPLISGPPAQQVRAAVDDILQALLEPPPAWPTVDAFLADGHAGIALFLAYLALDRDDEAVADLAVDHLELALEPLARLQMRLPADLCSGFTGVAWVVEHLNDRLLDAGEDDDLGVVDEELDRVLAAGEDLAVRRFDHVSGLVGLGVYALERCPRPWTTAFLEKIVARLEALAEQRGGGVTWWSDSRLFGSPVEKMFPDGSYNLGVAHGTPGVIAFLGRLCAAGVAIRGAGPLLEKAVEWLLEQRLDTTVGDFPNWILPDGTSPGAARSAWCYGHPGIAITLLDAARAVDEPDWERRAIDFALAAARRPADETGVRDAGLCHGAGGLAHMFHRLYQATGEEELAEAARTWLRRTLEMRRPGRGIAGWEVVGALADGEEGWVANSGFLTGAAGIGLALLAATSAIDPLWDRLLSISLES